MEDWEWEWEREWGWEGLDEGDDGEEVGRGGEEAVVVIMG